MRRLSITLTIVALFSLLCSQAPAGVPQKINYQGKLTDSNGGLIVSDEVTMEFNIYATLTGGTSLWSETHDTVTVTNGLFSVVLGSGTAIPESIFTGDTRYLGITVESDDESSPRMPIVSVGYAYRALRADTAQLCITYADSDWVIADTNIYRLQGNVGIGTNIPVCKLQVETEQEGTAAVGGGATGAGTSGLRGVASVGGSGAGDAFGVTGMAFGGINGADSVYGGYFYTSSMMSADKNYGVYARGTAGSYGEAYGVYAKAFSEHGESYALYAEVPPEYSGYVGYFQGEKSYFSGKVGIGTTTPGYDLDVNEDARVGDDLTVDGDATIDGNLGVGGTIKFVFDYESVWTSITAGGYKTLYHNLGGDPSKYIVFLTGKSSSGDYIHQKNYGTNYQLGWRGCEWSRLTNSSIRIYRGASDGTMAPDDDWAQFKIRIIKNQ